MKWWTCTPVAFGGGEDFFDRDSGLLSRGFRTIGAESRAVMPGPARTGDLDELIRTDYANLESPAWWRGHGLDGVVLYAWGSPRYRRVARAIREAGARLVLNQDNGGLVSPLCGPAAWLGEQVAMSGAGRVPGGYRGLARSLLKCGLWGLAATDPLRATHLKQGDRIACVSPQAAAHYRRLCRFYGGRRLAARVVFVPHPVAERFDYREGEKSARIVVVGRWDDRVQKRPEWLTAVAGRLLDEDDAVGVDVVGGGTAALEAWRAGLDEGRRKRVVVHGRVAPRGVSELLRRAWIVYCPSAYESFHIASGEGLCSGCSVVAAASPSLASFPWFVGDGDGVLAAADDVAGHADALRRELAAWRAGGRDPRMIARRWTERLHAPRVAGRILGLFGEGGDGDGPGKRGGGDGGEGGT